MRLIDADACESYFWEHLDDNGMAAAMNAINDMPTIEPQRKKGTWIEYDNSHCECPFCHEEWSYFDNEVEYFNYCPNCGADMRTPVETAKDIVHEAIDNSVWSDIVDTAEIAEMHMAVDDKYTEMTRNKQCQST